MIVIMESVCDEVWPQRQTQIETLANEQKNISVRDLTMLCPKSYTTSSDSEIIYTCGLK